MFFGQKEILEKEVDGEKNVAILNFTDGTKEVTTFKAMEACESETPSDATKMRELQCTPLAKAVLGLFLDYNIKLGDLDYVNALVVRSLEENIRLAMKKKWNGRHQDELTLGDVQAFLMAEEPAKAHEITE